MALFGISENCVANYPGDFGTALAAFDASVELRSASGRRSVPFAALHTAYGDDPACETVLTPGEIITAITVKATPGARCSTYVKVRDRESYAYALVSAAVALDMDGDTVRSARVSLGGVASRPWRSPEAAAVLTGARVTEQKGLEAGAAAFADARPGRANAFKIELGRRVVARAALLASQRS
jgi:xanthine dehydrogenase YagS FAD-binding subunit